MARQDAIAFLREVLIVSIKAEIIQGKDFCKVSSLGDKEWSAIRLEFLTIKSIVFKQKVRDYIFSTDNSNLSTVQPAGITLYGRTNPE